jgi:N-dimethylarginine dimethylaminohydrolase
MKDGKPSGDPRTERSAHWIYNETIKRFAAGATPEFESPSELEKHWGRVWGVDNDVGRIRAILMHRPGNELNVIDPAKRVADIGSYGDVNEGWYFQSDHIPPISDIRSQHAGLVAALEAAGIEIHFVDGDAGNRLKQMFTRDPLIMVKGGAIVCRMGARIRRGEELVITRTLARLGIPILRTLSGSAIMEGGSFAWINSKTAVIGCGVRVNHEGAAQIGEVLKRQGVDLIVVDLAGYDIHLDVSFLMVDKDLALVNPAGLPYSFLEQLKELKVETIEIEPADYDWMVNSLAVAPRQLLVPEGGSNRLLDIFARRGVEWKAIPYKAVHANGSGIHCSTTPLIRDPV